MKNITCSICSRPAEYRSARQAWRIRRQGLGGLLDYFFTCFGYCPRCGILFRTSRFSAARQNLAGYFGYGLHHSPANRPRTIVLEDAGLPIRSAFIRKDKASNQEEQSSFPDKGSISVHWDRSDGKMDLHFQLNDSEISFVAPAAGSQKFLIDQNQQPDKPGTKTNPVTGMRPWTFKNNIGWLPPRKKQD